MVSKFARSMVVFGAALVLAGCSGGGDDASGPERSETLAARIEDWTLSRDELEQVFDELSADSKAEYGGEEGLAALTDKLMQEELYHREGIKLGYDKDPEIIAAVENFMRNAVITKYFSSDIKPLARPSDEGLYEYYEDHQDEFTREPIARAQHIFSRSKETLVDFQKRIAEGEPMTSLAYKYSEDAMTRQDGGDLGYFNPDGYIRGVGYSKEISDAAFSLEVGVVSDPIKWRKGWSILRVNEFRPAAVQSFDDVKEEIADKLSRRAVDRVSSIALTELMKKYDCDNYLTNKLKLTQRTASELWNLAQNSSDSHQRLRSYEEIVDRFPDSEYSPQAMFMVGFVHAEELKDFLGADEAFRRVLREFPDSDVAESARYMLETMRKPVPNFQGVEGNKR